MSADNWAVCPRCVSDAQLEADKHRREVFAQYGKIPVADFDAMRASVVEKVNPYDHQTFREDYEIYGAEDGKFIVSYGGECSDCGLTFTYKYDETFYVPAVDAL